MVQLTVKGAVGEMDLLTQHEAETGRLCRTLRLEASDDGKSVVLIEVDERKVGIQREYRFEVTTGDLIALIRAHGAELPGENHVRTADAS
ncbi:conserved hypothetical protein [Paraburkholderia ribeironis]|uniref:Uncharacterized protein n=2 Tax=Paraburkholderia ribeironis TaxID=1247936 RepID=A0A1N7SPI7_9BURK|nr:conserved hypothetical protein [Paraburkholderia ribeironis]